MAASRLSKGPLTPLLKRFRWFPLAEPEKYGGSYLKNAWKDAPCLVVSLTCSTVSIAMLGYMIHQDEKDLRFKDRPFKRHYTVYRPDDPRIENLKARPQYYNPEGTIPDVNATDYSWHGPKNHTKKESGEYSSL